MRLDFRAHGRRPPAACLVRNSPPVEKITIEKTYAGDTRNDAKVLLLLINTITAHVSLYMVTCLLVLFTFSSDSLFDHLCPVYDESICKIHSSLPFFSHTTPEINLSFLFLRYLNVVIIKEITLKTKCVQIL